MAQIGSFTRGEDGTLTGTIRTLTLNVKTRFVLAETSSNEKAPALRVFAGPVEISKDTIAALAVKGREPLDEERFVIHRLHRGVNLSNYISSASDRGPTVCRGSRHDLFIGCAD